jgi:hypothetical protein
MRWMSSGRKPETGEPCAWKRASTVREGAERNVLKGNALAAYFTRKMEPLCERLVGYDRLVGEHTYR